MVDVKDLLTDVETEATREALYAQGANVKTEDYNNLDIYKINCTYYSVLGMMAKPISWHVCFNVLHKVFRRFTTLACWQEKMISNCSNQPKKAATSTVTIMIWKKLSEKFNAQLSLFNLLKFRNSSAAFDGEFTVDMEDANTIHISWTNTDANTVAELRANLKDKSFEITEKIDSERTSIYL